MTRDYLPPGDAGFLIWLQNFNTKLASHAVTVGVPPAEVTQFLADYTAAKSNIDDVAAIKASLQSSVSEKDDQRSEEHTSELQSHSEISYAVFCLKKKK